MSFDAYIPGATAVGVTYKDGVVLGAERRITLGSMVVSKKGKKVFRVTGNVGAVCAGMVADMQNLVKEVGVYAKLKELEAKRQLKASAVAKLTSVIMFERRFSPLLTQVILGGVDAKPRIWVLDPLGSLLTDEYASVGTGAEMATGVMEAGYSAGMSEKDARELTVSSIRAAIERDSMSGNGIDLLTLDRQGFREEAIST
ncbi:MAG TPA: proteasome subunit beta [Nitrososphaerales archaeon]|nr:proteasome subunit beta [Nitrososphaerales archaeon]